MIEIEVDYRSVVVNGCSMRNSSGGSWEARLGHRRIQRSSSAAEWMETFSHCRCTLTTVLAVKEISYGSF